MANNGEMKRISGLWIQEGDRRKYMSGTVGERLILEPGMKLFVFPAKERKGDKSPSHYICVAPSQAQRSRSATAEDSDVPF